MVAFVFLFIIILVGVFIELNVGAAQVLLPTLHVPPPDAQTYTPDAPQLFVWLVQDEGCIHEHAPLLPHTCPAGQEVAVHEHAPLLPHTCPAGQEVAGTVVMQVPLTHV